MARKFKSRKSEQSVTLVLGSRLFTDWVLRELMKALGGEFFYIEDFPGLEEGKKYIGVSTEGTKALASPSVQPDWTEGEDKVLCDVLFLFGDIDKALKKLSLKLNVSLSLPEDHFLRPHFERVKAQLL
jgi:hypothetical protein